MITIRRAQLQARISVLVTGVPEGKQAMTSSGFEGRVALVTGGAKGIGRACCEQLAMAGAKVAINYRSSEKAAEETAKLVEEAGRTAHVVRADVSSPQQVESMVAEVSAVLGPIDLLVNNAALFDVVSHEEATLEVWQRTLDTNLTGTYLVTWAVKGGMVERGFGRIVNITSVAALRGRPMCIPYSVSKAGVTAFTKGLSEAVAAHNIRVNAVAPGLTDTDMATNLDAATRAKQIQNTPLKRIGTPEDIANVVMFLLSEQSSFMTGQTVVASGGRVLLP